MLGRLRESCRLLSRTEILTKADDARNIPLTLKNNLVCRTCQHRIMCNVPANEIDGRRQVWLQEDKARAPYIFTKVEEEYITKGDPASLRKLNILLMNLYVNRESGMKLPAQISLDKIKSLMDLSSEEVNERIHEIASGHWLNYNVSSNCLLPQFSPKSITNFYNLKMDEGRRFGQSIVYDCSYTEGMEDYQVRNTAGQILASVKENHLSQRPFALHFCNLTKNDRLFYHLRMQSENSLEDLPITVSDESYLDHFPRKQLMYLSPHAGPVLQYSPGDVYILGAFSGKVDKSITPVQNAWRDGIRTSCLPVNRYLDRMGKNSLFLDEVLKILLLVKNTGDWRNALLKGIPEKDIRKRWYLFRSYDPSALVSSL